MEVAPDLVQQLPAKPQRKRLTKTVYFHIPSIVIKERRQNITKSLIGVKGVVSITYNATRNQCIIIVKENVNPEIPGKTIANLGYMCHLLTRDDNEEEIMIEMKADSQEERGNDSINKLPNYSDYPISDEESIAESAIAIPITPVKEKSVWKSASTFLKSFW